MRAHGDGRCKHVPYKAERRGGESPPFPSFEPLLLFFMVVVAFFMAVVVFFIVHERCRYSFGAPLLALGSRFRAGPWATKLSPTCAPIV